MLRDSRRAAYTATPTRLRLFVRFVCWYVCVCDMRTGECV